jgi:hypothetical protein
VSLYMTSLPSSPSLVLRFKCALVPGGEGCAVLPARAGEVYGKGDRREG